MCTWYFVIGGAFGEVVGTVLSWILSIKVRRSQGGLVGGHYWCAYMECYSWRRIRSYAIFALIHLLSFQPLLVILYINGYLIGFMEMCKYSKFRFTYTGRNNIKSLMLSKSNSYFTDKFKLSHGCSKHIKSYFYYMPCRVTSCLHLDCYGLHLREKICLAVACSN